MPSIAGIAANLLQITSAGEPSDPDSHPPQLGQDFCESPAGACPPVTLWDFQDVECRLGGDALHAIIPDRPNCLGEAHAIRAPKEPEQV